MQNMITALKMHSKFIPMKTKNLIVAAICLGSAFIAQQASAQWTLIDDLTTGHTAGNLGGQAAADGGNWVGIGTAGGVTIGNTPGSGSLTQGAISDTTGTINGADYILLPTAITAGNTDTVFFQFDEGASVTANNNQNWTVETIDSATTLSGGNANVTNATYFNNNETTRSGAIYNNSGFSQLFDGASQFNLAASTEYDMWMVITDPSASVATYNIWMSGGTLGSTPVEMGIGASGLVPANLIGKDRASTAVNGQVIRDFVFGPGGTFTGPGGGEALYTVWEGTGNEGGVTPVAAPEPGTMALMGLGGAALLLVRRNRKA
jgi:hypothetical protein